ncbi:MAG TPA: hypothetical protein VGF18_01285 [Candidatus Tumulicola sp.]
MMRFRTTAAVAIAVLASAACSGSQTASSITGAPAVGSWMSPSARTGNGLLYVTNFGAGNVTVYAYHGGNSPSLAGTLTGFTQPEAPCADAKGDVFVPDDGTQTITEFAYGATTPLQTLSDPGGTPTGCSVDPTTGNLAVANFRTATAIVGDLLIFTGATGTPATYSVAGMPSPQSPAYDDKGDLFVDGYDSTPSFAIAEMAAGQSTFTTLSVAGGTVHIPSEIQWGGTNLLVGDRFYLGNQASAAYRMSLSGTTLTIVGATPFTGAGDVESFTKRGSGSTATIVAPDFQNSQGLIYTFPSGMQSSTFAGTDRPNGAAIAQKHPAKR